MSWRWPGASSPRCPPGLPPVATPGTTTPSAKLTECVTVGGVREHLNAFQAIATANGGNRASGTPGYDASVDYVVERLEAAGYKVTREQLDFRSLR